MDVASGVAEILNDRLDAKVDSAKTNEEALEFCNQRSYAAVFYDMSMGYGWHDIVTSKIHERLPSAVLIGTSACISLPKCPDNVCEVVDELRLIDTGKIGDNYRALLAKHGITVSMRPR